MNCERVQSLIDAYTTDELDLAAASEVEQHLDDCSACAGAFDSLHALRRTLAEPSLRYAAPPDLRRRIGADLNLNHAPTTPPASRRRRMKSFALAAAAIALMLLLPWLALNWNSSRSNNDQLAAEITASHIRSLMGDHLLDVPSTDQHTVKPWFDGKIDFAPTVTDLATSGFPLIGGRLDYIHNRPVAALVYKRHQHIINLFSWPATTTGDVKPAASQHNGYNLLTWTRDGMIGVAVSDVNPTELQQFAQALQAATTRP